MTSSITDKRGFTLVEMLTVIAIVAVIAVLAVPALKTIQSTALQGASRQVSNALQLARQYAITHRTSVRLVLAVDTSSGNIDPKLIYRAYTICEWVEDADGNLLYWKPLQDWQFLADGVVFSDLDSQNYAPVTLSPPAPLGQSTRTLSDSTSGSLTFNNADNSFLVTNVAGVGTVPWKVSYIEFGPVGLATNPNGADKMAAIRLMQGSVLDPTSSKILITDTNNWTYIEVDPYGGRVRMRNRDSYK